MTKKYNIWVFGKAGCQKCKVLNQRLDALLGDDQWQDFAKTYYDVETEDGMVQFCSSECLNPQRIPAFVVAKQAADGSYRALANPHPGKDDQVCNQSRLFTLLGLQTDYTAAGRGTITPKMIKTILDQAASL